MDKDKFLPPSALLYHRSDMFGSLGFPEILLILVLALLIFGPKRLPEVGRTLGKGLSEFRRASTDLKRTVNAELSLDEDERPPTTTRRPEIGPSPAKPSGSGELATPAPAATAPRTEDDAAAGASPAGEPAEDAEPEPAPPSTH